MKLAIYMLTLINFGYSETQWVQTNKTTFCDKVVSCLRNSTKLSFPVVDDQSLSLHDTQTICEHANECGNSTYSSGDSISDNSDILQNSTKNMYLVNGNESAFCSVLNTCNDSLNAEEYDDEFKYLHNMTEVCPYVDFCSLNASMTISDPATVSCCKSCSCNSECGLNRECCFESQDNYNVVETEQLTCVQMKLTFGWSGFYMFDKCQNGTECYKAGSIPQPVSSAITKRIYINRECAQCRNGFNASAIVRWPMAFESAGFNDGKLKSCMNSGQQCKARYTVPGSHWDWILRFACGKYYKESCSDRLNSQNPDIHKACKSVHAPMVMKRRPTYVYRNVYCSLCSAVSLKGYKPTDVCPMQSDSVRRVTMSMLLDFDVFHAHKVDVCLEHDTSLQKQKESCHLVLCPDWMLRMDGTCVYYTKLWFDTKIIYQLILTPIKPIAAALLQNMTKQDQLRADTWLFNECEFVLDVTNDDIRFKLYMLPTTLDNTLIVKELYLRMSAHYNSLNPSILFPFLKSCLERRWKLVRHGKTYYLSASLYPYQRFMPDGKTKRKHVSLNRTYSETPLPRIYEPITTSGVSSTERYVLTLRFTSISVTKLAFCERVQLTSDEVDLLYGQIRIKDNNRTLSDGQFGVEYVTVDGDQTLTFVYVCVEDYVPIGSNAASSNGGEHGFGIICVMLIARMTGAL